MSGLFELPEPGRDVAVLAKVFSSAPRYLPVHGDYMEPLFKRGGFAAIVPAERYVKCAVYCLDFGIGPALFWAEHWHGSVRIWHENPRYTPQDVPLATFNDAVVGIAFASIAVLDPRLMASALDGGG